MQTLIYFMFLYKTFYDTIMTFGTKINLILPITMCFILNRCKLTFSLQQKVILVKTYFNLRLIVAIHLTLLTIDHWMEFEKTLLQLHQEMGIIMQWFFLGSLPNIINID